MKVNGDWSVSFAVWEAVLIDPLDRENSVEAELLPFLIVAHFSVFFFQPKPITKVSLSPDVKMDFQSS